MTLIAPRPTTHAAAPLLDVVGADLRIPLAGGREARHVNLDYAATAPALVSVAGAVAEALPWYASVHRSAGPASKVSTALYEGARAKVARFAGARDDDVVVFVRNTTDALNLLAAAVPGEVVHLDCEHHANLLPWRGRCVETAGTVGETLARIADELDRRPAALLAVLGASNVTGERLPLRDVVALAHARGARVAVDAAQLAPHGEVDLAGWGADYVAFSGHKLYAPYGAGALVGARDWLDAAPPHLAGGGAVRDVRLDGTDWALSPQRHEGGTPNLLGAVALAAACDALAGLAPGALEAHDRALRGVLVDGLSSLGATVLRMFDDDDADPIGLVTFTLPGIAPQAISARLAEDHGISVRDGRFCAHPLLRRLGAPAGAVRASFGVGTTLADIDALLRALTRLR